MSEQKLKPEKGHCPKCGPDRFSDVVGQHKESWVEDQYGINGTETYRILRCRGCETVYFQHVSWFCEEPEDPTITHWPSPSKRTQPDWIHKLQGTDADLKALTVEAYSALDNDLRVLAAIGIRTAFDKASELLGVDKNLRFADKLSELETTGRIGTNEKGVLVVLVDAGSAATHRGWKPTPDELNTMMATLESFIHRNLVLGHEVQKLKANVPPKKPSKNFLAKSSIKLTKPTI